MEDIVPEPFPAVAILPLVLDGIDEAAIAYRPDFTVTLFNRRAEEMFGIPASHIVGFQFTLDTAKTPGFETLLPIIYSSLAPTVVRLTDVGSNPQKTKIVLDAPVREFLVASYEASGGFVKIVREVTREESLVKSKGDFITIAAHQLRTPATAVNWTFENLEKDATLGDEAKETVRIGHSAAQSLLSVITHLLDAAQIEDGRFGYAFQPADLIVFLDALLGSAMPIAKQYGVNIYLDRPSEPSIPVSIDPSKFGLAVGNIVDNAVKYNVQGGKVTVSVALEGGAAHVMVKDTGPGIAPDDIPKLFGKFYRGRAMGAKVTEGSGLGLYLSKNIIEGHRGKVWVESEGEGRGSTFHFTLPLSG